MSEISQLAAGDRPLVEIDLAAVARNWQAVRAAYTGPRLGAVVKNDAYGLGLARIGPWLAQQGCRDFWVATFAEALALRTALAGGPVPQPRIFVLHGIAGASVADFVRHAVVPVLAGPGEIATARAHAAATGVALPVAVHLDTGLTRLGLDRKALAALAEDPASLQGLDVQAWVTHLGRFSDPDSEHSLSQRDRLLEWTGLLPAAARSIATSSSVFAGPHWHLELGRVGSALYGVDTTPQRPQPIEPAVTFSAPVLHVAQVPAGTEVGYAGNGITAAACTLATLALGYGDGMPFSLVNRGHVLIDGRPAPIVGGVSMGFVSVDVSAFAPGQVRAGSRAEVFGAGQRLEQLAADAGIAPNVLLLATASRAARRYIATAEVAA